MEHQGDSEGYVLSHNSMVQMTGVEHTADGYAIIDALNETYYNDSYHDTGILESLQYVDQTYTTVIKIEKICLPIICVMGLIGNTLSTITFTRKPLRKAPCSLYLATRGISDNGFLLSLLLIWTSGTFDLKLSQVKGVCQVTIFMTYVCGCVSVWLCVFITFENFLLIQSPYAAKRVCANVPKICIAVLLALAAGVYNISLWIIKEDCSHNPSFSSLTQILVYSDTLLTLVIPTVIIFILLSVIAYRMIKIVHVRRLHERVVEKITRETHSKKSILPIAKVTKMLFVVSSTFFILNVPSHIIRLMLMIGTFTKGGNTAPYVQATIQVSFQLIYYLSFSINIFVYAVFGSNFRKVFKKTFIDCFESHSTYPQTEAINLVRNRRHSVNVCGVEQCANGKDSGVYLMLSDQDKALNSSSI